MIPHEAVHRLPLCERLHRPREREPQDQRPERLPEHEEALTEAAPDVVEDAHQPVTPQPASRPRPGTTQMTTSTDPALGLSQTSGRQRGSVMTSRAGRW